MVFFSMLTVVLGSLASNDGAALSTNPVTGCVFNRSFCREVNLFIPNHCCFCLRRLG